jgi:NADH-quinone oxidoreductase subunit C
MTIFSVRPEALQEAVVAALGDKLLRSSVALGELTVWVGPANLHSAALLLRDTPGCQFEQLIDLCGVDYSEYGAGVYEGPRYCVVLHLLSISINQRVRLKVFAADDTMPMVDSVNDIWNSANWFEREAFERTFLPLGTWKCATTPNRRGSFTSLSPLKPVKSPHVLFGKITTGVCIRQLNVWPR